MFSNTEVFSLAPCPTEEDAAQIGHPMFYELNQIETRAFLRQIERAFPDQVQHVRLFRERNEHELGTYYEVALRFNPDNETAWDAALEIEGNLPECWDDEARAEIRAELARIGYNHFTASVNRTRIAPAKHA